MDPSTTNRGDHTAIVIAQAPAAVRRFPYLPAWRVVLCEECGFCLRLGKKALERHLGREHRLRGAELRALVELLESHDVWTPDEGGPPAGRWPTRPVPGLRVHDGYRCAAGGGCDGFVTRNLKSMERHGSKEHGQRAKAHTRNGEVAPLWVACKLQTFYAETRLIRYFVVAVGGGGGGGGGGGATGPARQGDGGRAAAEGALAPPPRPSSSDTADDAFFRALDEDAKVAAEDAKAEARVVEGFGSHRSAVIPWLRRTGIAGYIRGLDKAEMESSIAVPRKGVAAAKEGAAASSCGGDGPELDLILECMEQLLADTHRWCFDGPECKLTWPRQLALSRFRTTDAVARKLRGFDPYKEPATVDTYFGYWKQLVSFYFRVVHRGGHFAGGRGVRTPEDRVRPTRAQSAAWDLVWRRAAEGDTPRLRKALLGFSMSLICHRYKHYRYRSAVLGFAAMRSIQPTTGAWRAAGNYSSFLSGLIWTAQLLVFGASTGHGSHGGDGSGDCTGGNAGKGDDEDDDDDDEGDDGEDEGDGDKNEYAVRCGGGSDGDGEDDEDDGDDDDDDGGSSDGVLQKIEGYCGKYMRPNSETAFGEILAWRLLCREVGNEEVGQHQATWDEDGRGLTYGDVHLRLDEARKLFSSEVERARRLLYDELMFGADNLPRLKAPALKDDLGRRDVGWFFGMHRDNEPVLAPLERALEGVIKSSDALKNSFLDRSGPEVRWRSKAIALYEATVDSFLTALASPFHMANGQPLRESELFSITWRNTQRHRSIGLKHGRVMVHVTYHKGQQQTGRYKDNIRFLHPAMGNMLIDYMVYVLPLRLAFARHSSPKAVMSPYLWSKGGSRQMTVSIVKTKFTKEEARCFDIAIDDGGEEGEDAEEIDDDVRAMTKQRNHSTRTVNRAYSNQQGASFGGVWDGLVRRGLRASILWQQLWDLDTVLAPSARDRKRCCSEAGLLPGGPELLKRIAMGTYRRRTAWTSKALLQQARALLPDEVDCSRIHPDDAPTGLYATEHDSPEDESRIGDARISYTCNPIIHGLYREKPASLIIFDFDLNYDNTCAITRADIIITFGSSITDQLIRPHDVEIVPYATRLFGPKKACQEVSDATHIGSSATWRLKLNVSSMGIELPERADTISGTRTDSGWRLVGGPTFVDKPFRVRRVFRWRLTGHEFNRFPVPECFSVGMTVQHNMVDFWMKVRVEGALRGVVTNGMAKLSGWKTHHPNGWRVQPKRIERDINQSLLMREMQGKWLFDQWDPKEHEEENGG
ncbi:purine-cytosine permease [Purpureocillium lavendulum]|uniref:Purine-cytosine permease n=1 Tax=Purpureocillium lavendulum TaxID=1247861 RepID=A0AB34FDY6_9HYPO|nr:purine-cytosine permease [Purpureocillium lavendulum]